MQAFGTLCGVHSSTFIPSVEYGGTVGMSKMSNERLYNSDVSTPYLPILPQ